VSRQNLVEKRSTKSRIDRRLQHFQLLSFVNGPTAMLLEFILSPVRHKFGDTINELTATFSAQSINHISRRYQKLLLDTLVEYLKYEVLEVPEVVDYRL
jgi:hypothetical protein